LAVDEGETAPELKEELLDIGEQSEVVGLGLVGAPGWENPLKSIVRAS
jgi:hypothetical protein